MNTLEDRLGFALDIAREAGEISLRYFGNLESGQCEEKKDGTPVTVADQACEMHLRKRIAKRYPDDAVKGEEFDDDPGSSGFEWIIDPIDGTISFMQGVPLYGTMLACMSEGKPVVGVVHMPALGESVFAASGLGCWLSRHDGDWIPARASSVDHPSKAIVNTTSLSYFATPRLRSMYERLDRECKHTRGWSDAYAWVLLATGRVDAVLEPDLKLWDFAAAVPILSESGAVWSDLEGNESLQATQILAANPPLHKNLMAVIREHLEQ